MQKPLLPFFVFFVLFRFSLVAQNLVPNPSFEDTVACPTGPNQIQYAIGWENFANTPDYFNVCNNSSFNIPNAGSGFQFANTGVGMSGIITYVNPDAPDYPNYREYIGAHLLNQLEVGKKYFFSFYLNYSGYLPGWEKIASNKIGLKFTTNIFFTDAYRNNFAHLYVDSIITDTLNWMKLTNSFIADSAYNYVVIGNFFDDNQTNILNLGGQHFGGAGAYYYIDDISVIKDSTDTTDIYTELLEQNLFTVFPNPFSDKTYLQIHNSINKQENILIKIYDIYGRIIKTINSINNTNIEINRKNLSVGIYFLFISFNNKLYQQKIVIAD